MKTQAQIRESDIQHYIRDKVARNKAQHSPLPWQGSPAEQFLYNELELGVEGSANLRRSQQRAIINLMRKAAHADKLAEALRNAIEQTRFIYGQAQSDNRNLGKLQLEMSQALAAYEESL